MPKRVLMDKVNAGEKEMLFLLRWHYFYVWTTSGFCKLTGYSAKKQTIISREISRNE